jgi:hypothetical protein
MKRSSLRQHPDFMSPGSFRAGAVFIVASKLVAGGADVLTYHNDNARTGLNPAETVLTTSNVRTATFGKLFTLTVDGKVDAQPLYVSGVTIPNQGVHNVLIVASEHDSLYAFDADSGASLWHVSVLGTGETTSDPVGGCGQVSPEIGITATPVIDRTAGPNGAIYVIAMSKNGSTYYQRLHALDLTTGVELFAGPKSIDSTITFPGSGPGGNGSSVIFNPMRYKERAALLLLNGLVYTTWASHCDAKPYTGWVMGFNQHTLSMSALFNIDPNGQPPSTFLTDGSGSSFWNSGAGPAADLSGNIYSLSANGPFEPILNSAGFPADGDFGDAFLKFSTGVGLAVSDYFTPSNQQSLADGDTDLGSGNVITLPTLLDSTGVPRRLSVGAGKDANIYLVNRANMGKYNSTNTIWQEITGSLGGSEYGTSAYFDHSVYFGPVGATLQAYTFSNALLGTTASSRSATAFVYPGATPSISSNGNSNGIVWATENTSPAVLHAYDATNLASELYNSNMAASSRDQFGNGNKFIAPMIAGGKVYVGTTTGVGVFGILPGAAAPVITSAGSAAAAVGVAFRYQVTATNGPASFSQSGLPAGLVFNSASGIIAGIPSATGLSVVLLSATNRNGVGTMNLSISVAQGLPLPAPVAVFRDTFGAIRAIPFSSTVPVNAGGVFQSNPSSAQSQTGDTFVVSRDPQGGLWVNVFGATSQTWLGWTGAGGIVQGTPSIAVSQTTGIAYFAARDDFNAYWLNTFSTSSGIGSWTLLGGVFATDPVMAGAPDGSIYIIGRDNSNAIWSGHYVPSSGFQGWSSGGAVAQGKPSVTVGSDNAAYIAIRDNANAIWMGRVLGNSWTGWFSGRGVVNSDPVVSTMPGGVNFTTILDAGGAVWYRPFEEGPTSGWQSWTLVGGVLQSVSSSATSNGLFIVGLSNSSLWWYRQTSATWTNAGPAGVSASLVDASPK